MNKLNINGRLFISMLGSHCSVKIENAIGQTTIMAIVMSTPESIEVANVSSEAWYSFSQREPFATSHNSANVTSGINCATRYQLYQLIVLLDSIMVGNNIRVVTQLVTKKALTIAKMTL